MPDNEYGPRDTSYDTAEARARARRAEENERTDEYGLHKPAKSWTERLTDYAYPKEAANATDKPWYADLNAFKAIPAGFAGHVMDALSPWDTRGDVHLNMPILGEIGHGAEEAEYERKRAAAEQNACETDGGSWDDSRNECNPGEASGEGESSAAAEPNYTPAEPTSSEEPQ
ncbi:MAG: hypothetical protein KIT31_02180 [Deltaproteobacteria bacterium]|nr:hypothetical protein [Deltaproteobacteria bacterium]